MQALIRPLSFRSSESVEYIKNIGKELENLSRENTELKQQVKDLLEEIAQAKEAELKTQKENEKLSEREAQLMAILGYQKQMEQNNEDEWER